MFKIITYQLYLLQLENYELGRYFKLLFKKGLWPKGEQRKQLVWTIKVRLLFGLALATHLILCILFWFWIPAFAGMAFKIILLLVICYLLFVIYFILYTLYTILLWPIDYILKQIIIVRAKAKVSKLKSQIKIIGIAGSYGKTTMKEVIKNVLSSKYKVLSTPESVNTPVGISRWILKNVNLNTEILIVEMGEHYRGDIEDICNIVKPDISVVTGINESHMERMGDMDNIVATIFEVVSGTKAGGMVVLNGDDEKVMKHYKEFVWPDHKLEFFTKNSSSEKCKVKSAKFDTEKLGWALQVKDIGEAFVNLLGEYALGDVDAAVKIAKSLMMNGQEIIAGINKIKPVEHRLEPIKSAGNILVIDDAYNGNPDGVREAIKVLSRFINRRKIFITPGLVEMGKASSEVHKQIGKELAGVADVVVLIKNSVTSWIEEGINSSSVIARSEATKQSGNRSPRSSESSLAMTRIVWFNTAQEAHSSLSIVLKPGDVVVFQNDWGDQYV